MKINELMQINEEENYVDKIIKALKSSLLDHGGVMPVAIHDAEENLGKYGIAFDIYFDFPEGFVAGKDIKAAAPDLIQRVAITKSPDWRHGETGATYEITFKKPLSYEDQAKIVSVIRKLM